MGIRTLWLNLGWLVMLVVTIAVPLALDAFGRLTYFTSLAFWGIPILYLWPVFNLIPRKAQGAAGGLCAGPPARSSCSASFSTFCSDTSPCGSRLR